MNIVRDLPWRCANHYILDKADNVIGHIYGNIDALLVAAAPELLEACEAALEHLDQAQFDYRNGNTDPAGTSDEGEYIGWRYHKELSGRLRSVIKKAKGEA